MLLAFPPFNVWPLIFLAPIFFIADILFAPSLKTAIKKGFYFGLIFMGGFHVWMFTLSHWATPLSILGLWISFISYLSLFYLVLGAGIYLLRQTYWVIPILWAGIEYLKSLGPIGNPSGSIGYTQTHFPAILQLAKFGGIYFLSFVCLSISILFLNTLLPINKKLPKPLFLILIVGLLTALYIGHSSYKQPLPQAKEITVTVVQPNHNQEDKLSPSKWRELRISCTQINSEILKTTSTNIIFWPETITPGLNLRHPIFMEDLRYLCEVNNTTIVIGTPLLKNNLYFNSIAAITQNGPSPYFYDKQFLMPFGEYWPFRSIFYSLGLRKIIPETDFTKGEENRLIPIKTSTNVTVKIGSAICLESLYPTYFLQSTAKGATLLYTAVNNGWFFSSSVAEKHLQMTQVRAVENNRYTLQSANTGISAIISPKGDILTQIPLDTFGYKSAIISLQTKQTLYSKIKEKWLLLLGSLTLLFLLNKKFLNRKKSLMSKTS